MNQETSPEKIVKNTQSTESISSSQEWVHC